MRRRLGYLGFRVGAALMGVLPRRVAVGLGWTAGYLVGPLLRGRWAMARRHGRRLGVPSDRLDTHARRVFASYGRYWAETFWVRPRRLPAVHATLRITGLERVEQAKRAGRGVIVALPHVGNWEFAGPIATTIDLELVAVAEDLPNRRIRDWFVNLRRQMGIGVVIAGRSTTRELEAVLTRGGGVALLCDRDLKRRGVAVDFFGERTTLPAGPVRLALRTGAVLLPVASYFAPGVGHLVRVDPPIDVAAGDGSLEAGCQRLAEALERLILHDPGQWHLLQPNWPSDREA